MKIGTIIFAYNRSEHMRQVLEALSQNDVLPEKLYLFQDGMKESTNIDEWNKVGLLPFADFYNIPKNNKYNILSNSKFVVQD